MQTVQQLLDRKGRQVWTIAPNASVLDAIGEMASQNVGALVVVEDGAVVGVISERQYAREVALLGRSSKDTQVRDIMRTGVPHVTPDTFVDTCMSLITEHRTRHLPVMKDEALVGLVSIGDLVAAVIAEQKSTIEQLENYIASG